MKTIIAGSRDIVDYNLLLKAIAESGFEITEVVSGVCRGVDKMGERWAAENGIPVKLFPADWNKYPRAAGMIRNSEMANYAEALIALPSSESKGTKDMITKATKKGLKVFVYVS